jgi:hypothetical protein
MTQDQYLRLKPLRRYLDDYFAVGSVSIPHGDAQTLQDVHKELFGGNFNSWCNACIVDAMKAIFVQFDQYEAADAPVIISAGQTAKVKTKRGK